MSDEARSLNHDSPEHSSVLRKETQALGALSSSRSVVVCLSVFLSVGLSVVVCGGVCEKVTCSVSNGNKNTVATLVS